MENDNLKSLASQDLNYFEELFLGNKIDEVYVNYKNNSELKQKGYQYFNEYDAENKVLFEGWLDMSSTPLDGTDYIDFDIYLKREIDEKLIKLLKKVDTRFLKLSLEDFNSYFKYTCDRLYSYLKIIEKRNIKNSIQFISLKGFLEKIYALYPDIPKSHKVFNVLGQKENLSIAYFLPKTHLNLNFFHQLYDITVDLEVIDDIEIEEEKFITLFTSPNPTESLRFNKSNSLVVYYLDQIKIFFDGLTVTKISNSKLFHNKQGKPITDKDIYTTRSRNSKSKLSEKNRIKELIDELKEKYIK